MTRVTEGLDQSTGRLSDVSRLQTLEEAVGRIDDGVSIYIGGAVLRRKPMALLRALVAAGRSDLDLITFAGSVDIDLMLGGGCARSVSSAYVGLGRNGFAPLFRKAVEGGEIKDIEMSEWTMLLGLRAASMGMPFLPTRGGVSSQLRDHLELAETIDPYGTGTYLAVPPMEPDVALLHAWRATEDGYVQLAYPPEHLWDVDVIAARAAATTIVSVEEIIAGAIAETSPHLTALLPTDVDVVVHAPRGSWPTAGPPLHDEDHEAVARYAATGDVALLTGSAA